VAVEATRAWRNPVRSLFQAQKPELLPRRLPENRASDFRQFGFAAHGTGSGDPARPLLAGGVRRLARTATQKKSFAADGPQLYIVSIKADIMASLPGAWLDVQLAVITSGTRSANKSAASPDATQIGPDLECWG